MTALNRLLAVAGIEFTVALRNRWVLLATAMLTLFALSLVLVGASPTGAVKVDALTLSATGLSTLSVYFVPLLALLLTYDSLAGEIERGTLGLVLATPLRRSELVAAKFLGALAVLGIAVVIGYGIAAAFVVAEHGWTMAGLVAWGRLIGTVVLLGAVFIAVGLALSGTTPRAGTAAALAIGIWLVVVVLYDLALLGGLVVDGGGMFTKSIFPLLMLANPADAFRLFNLAMTGTAAVPVAGLDGVAAALPYPPVMALLALGVWLVLASTALLGIVRRMRP